MPHDADHLVPLPLADHADGLSVGTRHRTVPLVGQVSDLLQESQAVSHPNVDLIRAARSELALKSRDR